MALQDINPGEMMSVVRGKLNTNNTLVELWGNRVDAISTTPSTKKYPSEKAVADYTPKIYSSGTIPTTKSGDLILLQNGTNGSESIKGKLKYNLGGTLQEFVPDRAVCGKTAAALSSDGTKLLAGELAIESDTGKMKIGNGSAIYSALPYLTASDPGGGGSITYGGSAATAYDIQYQQGWIKFPNGMILQWGLSLLPANGYSNFSQEITLPVSFSKKRIYSHGILEAGTSWNDKQILVHPRGIGEGRSAISFTVEGGLNPNSPYELHWMAIGF